MSDVVLHPGAAGDDDGDGYIPRVALEHEGEDGHELYVIVGEETGGMIEGVPFEAMDGIADRVLTDDDAVVLLAAVMGDHMDAGALDRATAKLRRVTGDA